MADPPHSGALLQLLCDTKRAEGLLLKSNPERPKPAQCVGRVERRSNGTEQHRVSPQPVDQVGFARQNAEARIVVSRDCLGCRVHYQVDSRPKRLLTKRSCERCVDTLDRPLDLGEFIQIDKIDAWVRRGLGENQHGARLGRGLSE